VNYIGKCVSGKKKRWKMHTGTLIFKVRLLSLEADSEGCRERKSDKHLNGKLKPNNRSVNTNNAKTTGSALTIITKHGSIIPLSSDRGDADDRRGK